MTCKKEKKIYIYIYKYKIKISKNNDTPDSFHINTGIP